ncbi:4a-hydroxytetrahydrobiopterin dehydratase [Anaerolineae bacterium CFX7]|nr:4a-hydroxytetrahydrobiopterin dehydratase [Anaerolineae bacterium CFX7]
MPNLAQMQCVAARADSPRATEEEIQTWLPQIPEWRIVERDGEPQLTRQYKFKNFADALKFTNQVGALAEAADHHPQLVTEWGAVTVRWWTHAVKGLHRNDFIMAAKTDQL